MIRLASKADASQVAGIYNHYIENTVVSFEEQAVSEKEIAARIDAVIPSFPWLIYEEGDQILGYAYASRWHGRCAYRYSAESSVYLDASAVGRGVGSALYERLLNELRAMELHTVIGGIALPNPASVALHEKFGFKKVAHYEEVGFKFDRWIDVGYWQLKL